MTLGVPHGENFIKPHDPDWASLYLVEKRRIVEAIGRNIIDVQHIGSTAIPNIHAKPIIDIVVGTSSYLNADLWQNDLESIGYDYPGDIGIPDHRIYGRDHTIRRFLLHVVTHKGLRWNSLINFRDRLLANPKLALEYGKVKISAIDKYPIGRAEYTDEKSNFVESVLHGSV